MHLHLLGGAVMDLRQGERLPVGCLGLRIPPVRLEQEPVVQRDLDEAHGILEAFHHATCFRVGAPGLRNLTQGQSSLHAVEEEPRQHPAVVGPLGQGHPAFQDIQGLLEALVLQVKHTQVVVAPGHLREILDLAQGLERLLVVFRGLPPPLGVAEHGIDVPQVDEAASHLSEVSRLPDQGHGLFGVHRRGRVIPLGVGDPAQEAVGHGVPPEILLPVQEEVRLVGAGEGFRVPLAAEGDLRPGEECEGPVHGGGRREERQSLLEEAIRLLRLGEGQVDAAQLPEQLRLLRPVVARKGVQVDPDPLQEMARLLGRERLACELGGLPVVSQGLLMDLAQEVVATQFGHHLRGRRRVEGLHGLGDLPMHDAQAGSRHLLVDPQAQGVLEEREPSRLGVLPEEAPVDGALQDLREPLLGEVGGPGEEREVELLPQGAGVAQDPPLVLAASGRSGQVEPGVGDVHGGTGTSGGP